MKPEAPPSTDALVLQDDWSDLRRFRPLPRIDRDRLYRYRTGRLREQMRLADVAALVMVNPVSLRYAVDYSTYAPFVAAAQSTISARESAFTIDRMSLTKKLGTPLPRPA